MSAAAQGQTFSVLHEFTGFPNDGRMPTAPVMEDASGNLYGTTFAAGEFGGGIAFKLDSSGNETILRDFFAGKNGLNLGGGLVQDAAGNLYGTTVNGGDLTCNAGQGCGTVFKLDPENRLTILHRFHGGSDGQGPNSTLILDSAGNLWGTTFSGGDEGDAGILFRIGSTTGHLTVIRAFPSIFGNPVGDIVMDAGGNVYGTGTLGGDIHCKCGFVYMIIPRYENLSPIIQFNGTNGANPLGGVKFDASGNLVGATSGGGNAACTGGCGVVFRVNPSTLQVSVLHRFKGLADGANPQGGVTLDADGNIYGTTRLGGKTQTVGGGYGLVFKMDPVGHETVLHTFDEYNGAQPQANLLLDAAGNIYGTTAFGGSPACKNGFGVLFKITP
jgi:uncharacterized repeat protein (TIGR03803 family)